MQCPGPILNKRSMYRRLRNGAFGNTFRIWETAEEYRAAVEAGFDGLVGVRCVGEPGLPYFHHKRYDEAVKIGAKLHEQYHCPVVYYEASQDEFIILQGEFVELEQPVLEYSRAKTHMRAAFAQERLSAFGPEARLILKHVLTESSYEDFLALGELFQGAVIEFTAYEILVGQIPGRNCITWEVRHF